jgi:nucleotide-binding universal stress UspA family protein
MRVLVALDGSPAGDVARQLVDSVSWPTGTSVRLITVVPDIVAMYTGPWFEPVLPPDAPELETELVAHQRAMLEAARTALGERLAVDAVVRRGRAGTAIVDEASSFGADLVVMGARGHGVWAAALLGSVSAEVVDHAPCPVLVARTPTLERIVLAEDGSEGASRAREFLVRCQGFGRLPTRVVGVAWAPVPWQSGISPVLGGAAAEAHHEAIREARSHLEDAAHATLDALAAATSEGTLEVRVGDPAGEIVRAATDWGASLIVTGSRGRTGLRRVLLGSVARNVLHHASCSVLVVRTVHAEPGAASESAATAG